MKTDFELLSENPKALKRFCDLLIEHATVVGIEIEIDKISDSLRTQFTAARVCGLPTDEFLRMCRNRQHSRLLMLADAIGIERGRRIGREAAQRSILEARKFASLQLASNAPWSGEVEAEEDD